MRDFPIQSNAQSCTPRWNLEVATLNLNFRYACLIQIFLKWAPILGVWLGENQRTNIIKDTRMKHIEL